jgi:hypothetical protein
VDGAWMLIVWRRTQRSWMGKYFKTDLQEVEFSACRSCGRNRRGDSDGLEAEEVILSSREETEENNLAQLITIGIPKDLVERHRLLKT